MSRGTAKSERRKKSRKRPPSLIYVELASANGGMIRDLSPEGFAVRAMIPLRAGEKTPFSFLLNGSVKIEGEGEILWTEENGRVGGVRFTEISSQALAEVQNWLNDSPESSKRRAASEKIEAAPPSTFDQLREEIRSGRVNEKTLEAVPTELPAVALESVSIAPEITPRVPAQETTPLPVVVSAPNEALHAPASDAIAEGTPIPAPPGLSEAADFIDASPEPVPHAPGLPDISEILIQPRGREAMHSQNSSALAPLPVAEHARETLCTSWMDWFTLSRAITIMMVLAMVVAISTFHGTVGQGLIWLGEAMGGSQTSQAQLPTSNEVVSTSSPNANSPAVPDSPTQEPTAAEAPNRESAAGATPTGDDSQPSPSSTTTDTLAPVTPLSGIPGGSPSDARQEPGQAEYLHAEQLLRGKHAGADQSEAVRLLWIAVEKGNPNAEVALAEMYLDGQGVTRNCDQTRILLSAAARKGSAEAQKLLQQFQREGCE
jgi:hypothetical protein